MFSLLLPPSRYLNLLRIVDARLRSRRERRSIGMLRRCFRPRGYGNISDAPGLLRHVQVWKHPSPMLRSHRRRSRCASALLTTSPTFLSVSTQKGRNVRAAMPVAVLGQHNARGESRAIANPLPYGWAPSELGVRIRVRAYDPDQIWRPANRHLFQWGPLPFALSSLSFPGLSLSFPGLSLFFLSASLF